MAKQTVNNIKLGVFVLSGLLFLIFLLYMIGRNRNLFGATFVLKARFENVQGLVPGNNVRYAGITAGTVRRVNILNDTTIEVVMIIDDKMKPYIHENAIASIGTEGLMGNRVINIFSAGERAPAVREGDILPTRRAIDMDDMLRTLSKTNVDVGIIAENLKSTVQRLNSSHAVWELLNDRSLPENVRASAANIRSATVRANEMVKDLSVIVADVKNGKGSLGAVLTDTSFARNLGEAIVKIRSAGQQADTLAIALRDIAATVREQIDSGHGPVHALLRDSAMVQKINASLDNIQKGTDAFNENMEALKHNFLFRGYFRRLEKKKEKF